MAAMMQFHTERCCHLVNAHAASAWRIHSSVRQLPLAVLFTAPDP